MSKTIVDIIRQIILLQTEYIAGMKSAVAWMLLLEAVKKSGRIGAKPQKSLFDRFETMALVFLRSMIRILRFFPSAIRKALMVRNQFKDRAIYENLILGGF